MPNQFPLPTPPEEYIPPPPGERPMVPEQEPSGEVPLPPIPEAETGETSYAPPPPPAAIPPVRTSPFRVIAPVAIGLIVLGLIIFVVSRILSKPKAPKPAAPGQAITINYWGLWETPSIMKPVIETFEQANPGIKVNYQIQSHQDYQDRLQTALSGQTPPDIARIHSTWLPVFIGNLIPAPANTVSLSEIQTNFYPVVANSVIVNNQVYGVPLTLDGLVLYLNTNMLRQQNLVTPTTWPELKDAAEKLTQTDPVTGKITRAGVALGNTSNISHWPDILSLMLLQGGVNLLNPVAASTVETLTFYTSFAGQGKWDDTLAESVVAFANEKVAMIFAPLWRIPEIQTINPGLIWQTAPIPQLPDSDEVNWISMWMEVVPKNAPHPQEAWKFISFLASAKAQQLLFETAVKERGSSQAPANKAVAALASQNPLTAAFISGAEKGKTFYTAGLTRDSSTGLNSRLIKYLEDATNAIAKRQDPVKAVDTMKLGFNQVLSQYRLVPPLPTPTTR